MLCPVCDSPYIWQWINRYKDGAEVTVYRCGKCKFQWQNSYRYFSRVNVKRGPYKRRHKQKDNLTQAVNVHGKTLNYKQKGDTFIVLK